MNRGGRAFSESAMHGKEYTMKAPVPLVCPHDGTELIPTGDGGYESRSGRTYPALKGIPRFVEQEGYASAFGAQWKRFQRTQLDSHTKTTLSRDRLERIAGGSLDVFAGKTVLEVGCGAGRFTEILLDALPLGSIECARGGNGVECRARKSVATQSGSSPVDPVRSSEPVIANDGEENSGN